MRQLTLERPDEKPSDAVVPPLKWAGGKRWLLPHLRPLWYGNEQRRLVEPFAGGLAVTLGLQPREALLNDINEHVINFYNHLKAGLVSSIPSGNTKRIYYENRTAFNKLILAGNARGKGANARRAAMYFYYLNRHCYNGLCRFNRKGEFNTPIGDYVNPKYDRDLRSYAPVLKNWQFISGDFKDVPLKKGDFVYADPPYDEAFTSYSEHAFGFDKQKELVEWLADHDGPVVLSNHATTRILAEYEKNGFDVSVQKPAPRMIHCFGDRTPAMEVIATKGFD